MPEMQGALNAAFDATERRLRLTNLGDPVPQASSLPFAINYGWSAPRVSALTKQTMSVDGTHVSQGVYTDPKAVFTLSAGTTVAASNLRDWYLVPGTSGRSDHHGIMLVDPLFFGNDPTDGDIFPQMGMVLRAQESGGKRRGVTINNGTIFGLAQVNMGVWSANLDGTGFVARTHGFPVFSNPSFPYWIEARLQGTKLAVRCWGVDEAPPSWDHTTRARRIDIDQDIEPQNIGTNPSPTGSGSAGLIVAHLGTSALSALRTQYTAFNALGPKGGHGNPIGRSLSGDALRVVTV